MHHGYLSASKYGPPPKFKGIPVTAVVPHSPSPCTPPHQDKAGAEQHLKQTLWQPQLINGSFSGTCEHKPTTLHAAVPAPWEFTLENKHELARLFLKNQSLQLHAWVAT